VRASTAVAQQSDLLIMAERFGGHSAQLRDLANSVTSASRAIIELDKANERLQHLLARRTAGKPMVLVRQGDQLHGFAGAQTRGPDGPGGHERWVGV